MTLSNFILWPAFWAIACLGIPLSAPQAAAEEEPTYLLEVTDYLVLGPLASSQNRSWPQDNTKAIQDHLAIRLLASGIPSDGDILSFLGSDMRWRRISDDGSSPSFFDGHWGLYAVFFQVEAHRWQKTKLLIDAPHRPVLYVDSVRPKIDRRQAANSDYHPYVAELELMPGSHSFLFLFAGPSEKNQNPRWHAAFEAKIPEVLSSIQIQGKATRLLSAQQLWHAPQVSQLAISPNGDLVMVQLRWYDQLADRWESRYEMRESSDGQLARFWTNIGDRPRNLQWSPDGRWFSYITTRNEKMELTLVDLADGKTTDVLKGVEGVAEYLWAPDGRTIFFDWVAEADEPSDGLKRHKNLHDRWAGWRDLSRLHRLDIASGWIEPITDFSHSLRIVDVTGDSRRLLIAEDLPDYSRPPYEKTQLKEINLESGETRLIKEMYSFTDARYFRSSILVVAGVSSFGGIGKTLGESVAANDYDGQIFRLDANSGEVIPLSRQFKPSIQSLQVHEYTGQVLVAAVDRSKNRLFFLDIETKKFRPIESHVDVTERFSLASKTGSLVWSGSSVSQPQRVYYRSADDPQGSGNILMEPAQEVFRQTRLGKVNPWTFENRQGEEIDGRYYTPPDFDASRKYPLIVYYYGGTFPVTEAFGGRYPWNLWAALGYVVYVLQPSGTVGYGQQFSARHVNAWGKITANEIIQGTEEFIKAHDFVDNSKIGCIGASYGGFMTMYLLTRTNIFAAAVAHAGISALHSYWGEGWWGFNYSAVASRGSFPWNNRDLYVDQSPLFSADKIRTPLLLLHGTADTNVPVGESHQLFTALQLLQRQVELVTVEDENHLILEHDKRLAWWQTIHAWFAKQLKGEPEWWIIYTPMRAIESNFRL